MNISKVISELRKDFEARGFKLYFGGEYNSERDVANKTVIIFINDFKPKREAGCVYPVNLQVTVLKSASYLQRLDKQKTGWQTELIDELLEEASDAIDIINLRENKVIFINKKKETINLRYYDSSSNLTVNNEAGIMFEAPAIITM